MKDLLRFWRADKQEHFWKYKYVFQIDILIKLSRQDLKR